MVCDDEFLYTTLSSWIGLGSEFEQQIKLNPVKVDRSQVTPVLENLTQTAAPQEIEVTPDADPIEVA
jgi:hypothetical protein